MLRLQVATLIIDTYRYNKHQLLKEQKVRKKCVEASVGRLLKANALVRGEKRPTNVDTPQNAMMLITLRGTIVYL